MNPVLVLTRNNLDLTQRCVESIQRQDIPTCLLIIDNGSTDGTREWIASSGLDGLFAFRNEGVSKGWNAGLNYFFNNGAEHVLICGNDTILPPWTYRALLSANVPFVSGVDVGMGDIAPGFDITLSPHPDFSCFLIRRECWETVGPFNERLVHYCGDCDYHIRAHRLNIPLYKASVPYNHERSSTLNRATPGERKILNDQADIDREVFHSLYGCLPGSADYENLFK